MCTPLNAMKKGLFIVFEGIDGCGKSTQTSRTKEWLEINGYQCEITQEPTESSIGKFIRNSIRGKSCEYSSLTQILLFSADRMDHVDWIKSKIESGICVLCDRFIDSTYAYQIDTKEQRRIYSVIEEVILEVVNPILTIFLDIPVVDALDRIQSRDVSDCFEKKDFLEKVAARYAQKIDANPDRYTVISSLKSVESVFEQIKKTIKSYIGGVL